MTTVGKVDVAIKGNATIKMDDSSLSIKYEPLQGVLTITLGNMSTLENLTQALIVELEKYYYDKKK